MSLESNQTDPELKNSLQLINRIPVELLAKIFVVGDELDQIDDKPKSTGDSSDTSTTSDIYDSLEFQEIVAQVCRHWRTVALSMPTLWSYIRIDDTHPRERAALFLARSGNTCPLDIEIDMSGDYMGEYTDNGPERQVRVHECLQFIVSHGGTPSRWGTVNIWSEFPDITLYIIDFMAFFTLDNLRTLELDCQADEYESMDELITRALSRRDPFNRILFTTPPPLLKRLVLFGIPTEFLFTSTPLVSNLTSLELATVPFLPPLDGLYDLLSQNPDLETLDLDMSMVDQIDIIDGALPGQILLPRLRYFALKEPMSTTWALHVLMMVDAPNVEHLVLDVNHTQHPSLPGEICQFISKGRPNGQLAKSFTPIEWVMNPEPHIPPTPIFPNLQHLTLGPFPDSLYHLTRMIGSFSTLTQLDWELEDGDNMGIRCLSSSPPLCPQLTHLRTYGVLGPDLVAVVQARHTSGVPLAIVEINSRDWETIEASDKNSIRQYAKLGQYVDDNESDSEDDWSDTDENSNADSDSGIEMDMNTDTDDEDEGDSSTDDSWTTDDSTASEVGS